jgi:hypothetical protein
MLNRQEYSTKYVHIKSTTVYAPRWNWDSPQPPTRRLVCPLPPVSGGRGTLAGEKGVGRVPIPTRGIHCGTLYMYVLCGVLFLHRRSSSWTTLVLYSRVVFIFNEPTNGGHPCTLYSPQVDMYTERGGYIIWGRLGQRAYMVNIHLQVEMLYLR